MSRIVIVRIHDGHDRKVNGLTSNGASVSEAGGPKAKTRFSSQVRPQPIFSLSIRDMSYLCGLQTPRFLLLVSASQLNFDAIITFLNDIKNLILM